MPVDFNKHNISPPRIHLSLRVLGHLIFSLGSVEGPISGAEMPRCTHQESSHFHSL